MLSERRLLVRRPDPGPLLCLPGHRNQRGRQRAAVEPASGVVTTQSWAQYTPTVTAEAIPDNGVRVSWQAELLATSYKVRVYEGTTPANGAPNQANLRPQFEANVLAVNSTTISGLTNGKHYYFTVTPTYLLFLGGTESLASLDVVPFGKPFAPVITGVDERDTAAIIRWREADPQNGVPGNNGSAIQAYTVQIYREFGALVFTSPELAGNQTSYEVSGLTNSQRYYATVIARNAAGSSGPTQSALFVPFGKPFAPQDAVAFGGSRRATVSWTHPGPRGPNDEVAGNNGRPIIGWSVTVSPPCSSGPCPGSRNIPAEANSTEITGLLAGRHYEFQVFAINEAGTGAGSNVAQTDTFIEAPEAPGPPTVSDVHSRSATSELTLSWSAPTVFERVGAAGVRGGHRRRLHVYRLPCHRPQRHLDQDHRARDRRGVRLPGAGNEQRRRGRALRPGAPYAPVLPPGDDLEPQARPHRRMLHASRPRRLRSADPPGRRRYHRLSGGHRGPGQGPRPPPEHGGYVGVLGGALPGVHNQPGVHRLRKRHPQQVSDHEHHLPPWELTPSANEDSKPKRVLQRVTVVLPGGVEVHVYNTHIASDATDPEKETQARAVLRPGGEDRAGAATFRPIFLCDCNNTPTRPSISSAPPNTGITTQFHDAWASVAHPSGETGYTDNPRNPTKRIDYVFVGKQSGFTVREADVDEQAFLSDHSAVVAELKR